MVKTIGNVQKDAQVRAVASGALSNGDTVIVNSDGTVSGISIGSDSAASSVTFNQNSTNRNGIAADPNSGKVLIVYKDGSSGNSLAVVGTISGTSISFGTPVTMTGDADHFDIAYNSVEDKYVVVFEDNTNSSYGTAIVGTISGTTVSFGTKQVYRSGASMRHRVVYYASEDRILIVWADTALSYIGRLVAASQSGNTLSYGTINTFNGNGANTVIYEGFVYDAGAEKAVVFYRDVGNSNYGNCKVISLSGSTPTIGAETNFKSSTVVNIGAAYDSANQKIVLCYGADGNGYAKVCTVSGTSISFGSEVTFSSSEVGYIMTVYDSNAAKVVTSFRDSANSYRLHMITGEVSGTTSTWGTKVQYATATSDESSMIYSPNQKKVVSAFRDNTDNGYGKAVVFTVGSTNLTSDNFIGFADGSYADTQSAAINSTCSVDDNQTGLTAGQKYYVQSDGTLSTTAGSPTVEAGTAISPTKILVKG